jgi:hypothetical protein
VSPMTPQRFRESRSVSCLSRADSSATALGLTAGGFTPRVWCAARVTGDGAASMVGSVARNCSVGDRPALACRRAGDTWRRSGLPSCVRGGLASKNRRATGRRRAYAHSSCARVDALAGASRDPRRGAGASLGCRSERLDRRHSRADRFLCSLGAGDLSAAGRRALRGRSGRLLHRRRCGAACCESTRAAA